MITGLIIAAMSLLLLLFIAASLVRFARWPTGRVVITAVAVILRSHLTVSFLADSFSIILESIFVF